MMDDSISHEFLNFQPQTTQLIFTIRSNPLKIYTYRFSINNFLSPAIFPGNASMLTCHIPHVNS